MRSPGLCCPALSALQMGIGGAILMRKWARLGLAIDGSRKFRVPVLRMLLIAAAVVGALICGIVIFYYQRYSGMIDERISGKTARSESRIFGAPKRISVGQVLSPDLLASYLQTAGYSSAPDGAATGGIKTTPLSIEIRPSANSYFAGRMPRRSTFRAAGSRVCARWIPATD